MANNMGIYAIIVRELLAAPLSIRIGEPYRFGWPRAVSPEPPPREENVLDWAASGFEWAKDTLRLADSIEGEEEREKSRLRAWETEASVNDVLFDGSENYWELPDSERRGYLAPGIIYAGDVRHSEYVYQDMRAMCCYLPEPTRSAIMARFGDHNIEHGADFPRDVSANSLIRSLNLPGCLVLHRHEVKMVKKGYESMGEELGRSEGNSVDGVFTETGKLYGIYTQAWAWNDFFEERDRCPGYDFAFFHTQAFGPG
jgi:hypothetical protein